MSQCDFLSVLVCYENEETISGEIRKQWIESTFTDLKNTAVKVLNYDSSKLPNTSETSSSVSAKWAIEFKKQLPDYSLVITSEPYGELVANYMGIKHIPFDLDKTLFPVSATQIRNNLFANWYYLPNAVKTFFSIKVVILGTESTGKTTLSEQLAKYFQCSLVLETGRDLIPNSNTFGFDDLHLVAIEHAKRINAAIIGESPLIVIDTDIHITKSYCEFVFNKELLISESIYNSNKADLYLYLNKDAPHYQDGTRMNKNERDLLDESHREVLTKHQIDFVEISGNWQNRLDQAVIEISKLIISKSKR